MRLSFYTYSYTDRLKMSIPACLERIAKAGYSGIDISGTNGNSADPKSFDSERRKLTRKTTERFDLRVEAVITHAQLTDTLVDPKQTTLDLKGSVDLAQEVGATVVTFHMGGYHKGHDKKETWNRSVSVIKDAADYGARRHIQLAVDGIWPVWIDDTPDSLQKLFDDVDNENFGVNFDPCYLTLINVDPSAFFRRFKERIRHAHLKDHSGKYPKWEHKLPGDGEMDYSAVFKTVAQNSFKHSLAVECFTDMKFEKACDHCFKTMTAAARKVQARFRK